MGVYNPHVPYVLGQEWAPIRNEDYQFNPDATVRETGYGFTLTAPRQLNNARFYTNTMGGRVFQNHCASVSIYPRGREALSGPIRKVIIPCNNGALTGGPGAGGPFITLNGGATLAECLASAGDFKYVEAKYNTSPGNAESGRFNMFFAVNDFVQILQGKRILNVTLLYAGRIIDHSSADGGLSSIVALYTGKNQIFQPTILTYQSISAQGSITYGVDFTTTNSASDSGILGSLNLFGGTIVVPTQAIQRLDFGDFDPIALRPGGNDLVPTPWSLASLQKLDARNGISSFVNLVVQTPIGSYDFFQTSTVMDFDYFALEVTFCEETRVAAGNRFCQYVNGLNFINMTDLNLNLNPILAAGDYTATLGWVSPGDRAFILDDLVAPYPAVNAAREKYTLNSMPGLQVNIPFPLNDHIGDTFTKETTHVIPQISLHTSGGGAPFVEPHVYGRQIAAQIFGTVTASQNLLDSAVGGNASFPQVRYYARRFGNTTVPLTLTGTSPTVSGSSVSITPTDFDALTEIIDGWKEVTLRFNNIPVMGAGVTPTWQWSAAGELAGNRWEVMGAMAPAVSGGGSFGAQASLNPYTNPAPVTSQLSTATYGQPAAGSTVNMTWLPGFSPPVSGTTADPWTDAVLLFSQDMPTVTGFTVVTSNQALTGVALNCTTYPWYVPSAMAFNNITWSATSSSVPVSGFAYYELQRQDTISTDWFTIAQLTSPSASGFKDYEARVGITTSYRIRSVNALLFAGPWSSTITNSFNAPGVTGQGMGANARALLFTSNKAQNGARNLAYAIAADDSGSEAVNFPEAGFTQFQFMYGRDYQTAFRPLERGGTTFQRSVVVQAAAISPPTLADFNSIRDLAWDSLPYVCVRDEDGNRWLANVAVPQGAVRGNNRTIYIADLTITEVTGTPAITVV